jgi:hypothetical protein
VLQISAVGQQDSVINGMPTDTIWSCVHTRLASSALDDELQDLTSVAFNSSSTLTINRYGDLVTRIALEVVLPPLAAPAIPVTPATSPATFLPSTSTGAHYVNCIGYAIFDSVSIDVGGSTIDQLYSDYCFVYEELAGRPGLRLQQQIGRVSYSSEVDQDLIALASRQQTLYVPLPLWISKYQPDVWGLALPIACITSNDVRLKLTTRSISDCTAVVYQSNGVWNLAGNLSPLNATTGAPLASTDLKIRVMITSVYLGDTERDALVRVNRSYLINLAEQSTVAVTAGQSTKVENRLYLTHPTTALIWVVRPLNWNAADGSGRRRYSCGFKDRYDFSSLVPGSVSSLLPYGDVVPPIQSASLSLSGHQRWPIDINASYFTNSQPYTAWRTMPSTPIYTYAFALKAAEWQPTATVNFSKIDNVSLGLTYAQGIQASELIVISQIYNVLLIENGLAGKKFA